MAWRIAQKNDIPAIKEFILSREWRSVAFSAHLKEGISLSADKKYTILVNSSAGWITDTIMLTPTGTIIPVLSAGCCLSSPGRRVPAAVIRCHTPLYSVIGIDRDVQAVEKLINRNFQKKIAYYLMIIKKSDLKSNPPLPRDKMQIRQARGRDIQKLMPLQENYEKEEVCLDPGHFSRKVCYANLKKILASQTTFIAEEDGKILAKAGTNARGYRVAQIGGVYTLVEKRNQGIGFAVMQELLKQIFTSKEMACLFVKTANTSAITLYRNLGFILQEKYRISYYNI